jgi:hypothetical protein
MVDFSPNMVVHHTPGRGHFMHDISPSGTGVGDIKGGTVGDWLVTGWFTPNYRPLAEAFAANLSQHGAPFHLWAKPNLGKGWNTSRKPAVVLETMAAYPGKTVVLMDVDCIVRGDIAPITRTNRDVGIVVIARNMRNGRHWRHWLAVECSSRVVVFRPTDGARAFAKTWAARIERSAFPHDEHSMAWAFLASVGVHFSYIDQRYSGREVGQLPDAVICHDSAHEKQRKGQRSGFKAALQAIERRYFRTGRTKAGKLKGELSVLIESA